MTRKWVILFGLPLLSVRLHLTVVKLAATGPRKGLLSSHAKAANLDRRGFPAPPGPTTVKCGATASFFADLDNTVEISPDGKNWIQVSMPSNEPRPIPPGGTLQLQVNVVPTWPPSSQAIGVAAAASIRVTATMVYSIGPTARISQTVVFARPQKVYLPLAERNLAGAW